MSNLIIPRQTEDVSLQAESHGQLEQSNAYIFEQSLKYNITDGLSGTAIQHQQQWDQFLEDGGKTLTIEELKQQYPDELIKFDRELTKGQAELLRERKLREIEYSDMQERTRGMKNVTSLTAGLVAGVLDPIGSITGIGFAPAQGLKALGPLRAKLLSSSWSTRAMANAAITGVDAAIGNAMLEPYMMMAQRDMYSEYDLLDSFANVVFGSVFGAGVGFGAHLPITQYASKGLHYVGDWTPPWLRNKSPDTNTSALHTAVSQALDGKTPEVTGVLKADANIRADAGLPVNQAELSAGTVKHTPDVSEKVRELVTGRKFQTATQSDLSAVVSDFTSGRLEDISDKLRTGVKLTGEEAQQIELLDEFLNRGKRIKGGITAYAGIVTGMKDTGLANAVKLLGIGDTFTEAGHIKASTSKQAAIRSAMGKDGVVLKIDIPEGRYGRMLKGQEQADAGDFILDRNIEYVVKSKDIVDGRTEITLEPIKKHKKELDVEPWQTPKEAMEYVDSVNSRTESASTADLPRSDDLSVEIDSMQKRQNNQKESSLRQQELIAEFDEEIRMLRAEKGDVPEAELLAIDKQLSELDSTKLAMYEAANCLLGAIDG